MISRLLAIIGASVAICIVTIIIGKAADGKSAGRDGEAKPE